MIGSNKHSSTCRVPGSQWHIPTPCERNQHPSATHKPSHRLVGRPGLPAAGAPPPAGTSQKTRENELLEDAEKERALVNLCLAGNDKAWEAIVRSYGKRVFNLSFRFTGHVDDAEDLTQEIFIRAFQNLKSYRSETGSFQSWFLRVGRNLIIDYYRREKRFQKLLGSDELETLKLADSRSLSPHRAAEQAEVSEMVKAGLTKLAPEVREAIVLRDMDGLSYSDIARVVGVPAGTIKSRVSRGRTQLSKVLSRRQATKNRSTAMPLPASPLPSYGLQYQQC